MVISNLPGAAIMFREAGNYDVWDSGSVQSDESIEIPYEGLALEPGVRYYWKVLVTDNKGNTAVSAEDAYWEMGLMELRGMQNG